MAEVNIGAIVAIIVFYVILLVIGVYAARKRGKGAEEMMLAGRNLGWFIGICTMTATWTGGGFINGTAEVVYDVNQGVMYAFAVWAAPVSMLINGLFFCKKMRSSNYVTMLDPFQLKYGSRMTGLLFVVIAISEVFWAASIFYALGTTFNVVLGLERVPSVLMSAAVTVAYSMLGGLYSVAYTDVIQLAFIFIGVWLSLPFAVTNPAVSSITENSDRWVGQWSNRYAGVWAEYTLMGILGSVPWQEYYQRVLACKTIKEARILTFGGAVLSSAFFALPSLFLGAAGATADWTKTSFYQPPSNGTNGTLPTFENSLVLPMVLQYLTPNIVSFIGLGAVAAAVMSSADSILIASSSLFAHNVYKLLIREQAKDKEIVWVMRIALLIIGACAAAIALVVQSVIYLFYLCVDLVYVIVFPQLCAVIYFESSNVYGALAGYVIALILRMLGGDGSLGIKPVIEYPYYSPEEGQLFPFRTLAMLVGLLSIIVFSKLAEFLFTKEIIPPFFDVFHYFHKADLLKSPCDNSNEVKGIAYAMTNESFEPKTGPGPSQMSIDDSKDREVAQYTSFV